MKLTFLIFVWGPAFLGFSLGWLVLHPDDGTGPAVIAPLSSMLAFFTYRWGIRKQRTLTGEVQLLFRAGMIAAPLVGAVVFLLLVSGILDRPR